MKMKMRLKKQVGKRISKWGEEQNVDTGRKVKEVLAALNAKTFTVLALAPSSRNGKTHQIRWLANGMVICTCESWQYSKTGEPCKHLKRFRAEVKPLMFADPTKK